MPHCAANDKQPNLDRQELRVESQEPDSGRDAAAPSSILPRILYVLE
jgi:hypothetical protein